MKNRTAYIYALGDPRDGEIFYIGQSIDPAKRWENHRYGSSTGKALADRQREIGFGLRAVMVILARVPESQKYQREYEFICDFQKRGCRLVNKIVKPPTRPITLEDLRDALKKLDAYRKAVQQ